MMLHIFQQRVVMFMAALGLFALGIGAPLKAFQAQDKPAVFTSFFDGVAIGGYDTVAYFTVGEPRRGKPEFAVRFKEATWLFETAEHRDLFLSAPEKYAPQFGGHGAWSMASGAFVRGHPDYWVIENDRLYLAYDGRFRARWMAEMAVLRAQAEENYRVFAAPADMTARLIEARADAQGVDEPY